MEETTLSEPVESAEPDEAIKISEADHKAIIDIANNIEKAHLTIGSIEIRKFELTSDVMSMRSEMDTKAREAMLKAGITEEECQKYRINVQTGELVQR